MNMICQKINFSLFIKYIVLIYYLSIPAISQVGINTLSPQGDFDIVSLNNTGVVLPRVSCIENVTNGNSQNPVNGTIVYDKCRDMLCYLIDDQWIALGLNSFGQVITYKITTPFALHTTYFKATNTDPFDLFGTFRSLNYDGSRMVVAATGEDSNATGINGNEADNSMSNAGAVYVYRNDSGIWSSEAYIKASNTNADDIFGVGSIISRNGNTIAVGAPAEASNAMGINGNQTDNSLPNAGAAYIFTRTGAIWTQQAYLKASNPDAFDNFGDRLALSEDGNWLAISDVGDDSNATGINGDASNNSKSGSGAVYIFNRVAGNWSQQAYIKASNTDSFDAFGYEISLNSDGSILAVGAPYEKSNATGINGNQANNSFALAGAVYLFNRNGNTWTQSAYIKASNTDSGDNFGSSVVLNGDGNYLIVGAPRERSSAVGINGNQADNSVLEAGAAYLYFYNGTTWAQKFYIKSSNTQGSMLFSTNVAMSDDGTRIAVGSRYEGGESSGFNGDQTGTTAYNSGSAYTFLRIGNTLAQQNYIKASNADPGDFFSFGLGYSGNGCFLAIGANTESSNATGINGDQFNNNASAAGAVYIIK